MASQTVVIGVRCFAPGSIECKHLDHQLALDGFKDEVSRHLRHTPSETRFSQPLVQDQERGDHWLKVRFWVPEAHDEKVWSSAIQESLNSTQLHVDLVVFGEGEPALR